MAAKVQDAALELHPVHHHAEPGGAQPDRAQPAQDAEVGSSSGTSHRRGPSASVHTVEQGTSLREDATMPVSPQDPGQSAEAGVPETTSARPTPPATPTSAASQQAIPSPTQQQRPQQQVVHRRRRARVRLRVWLMSKFYVVKIALASKRGKMITTCTFAFVQIGAIIGLLIASAHTTTPASQGVTQWDACPRRLQAFDIIQVGKAVLGLMVNVWWILRQPNDAIPGTRLGRVAYRLRQDFLPYFTAILHIVLSAVLFSTLTSYPTAWDLSPTIFLACVFALFRTWLAVAEVVLLVVGGAIYAICYASLAIFCPGILPRRAARLGGINPTIGPLSPTQLEQIPIVQYAAMSTVSLALPSAPTSTLERLRLKRNPTTQLPSLRVKGPKRHKIEKHRAACAICLNDFVDMKRVNSAPPIEQPPSAGTNGTQYGTAPNSPVSPTSPAPAGPGPRRSEGTGVDVEGGEEASIPVVFVATEESPRPDPAEPEELRLLPCDHVFHKDCIDPWLKDVSGRCPTCQRPVFGGEGEDAV